MEQTEYGACTKTYILETEPYIDQHKYRCYQHSYDGFLLHFITDGGADGFRCDLLSVNLKIICHGILKGLTLFLCQGSCFENNLIGSVDLLCLYITVTGNILDQWNYPGINICKAHILIEGNTCRSTANELKAVIQRVSCLCLIHTHKDEACNDHDKGSSKENCLLLCEPNCLSLSCYAIQLRIRKPKGKECFHDQLSHYHGCKHG